LGSGCLVGKGESWEGVGANSGGSETQQLKKGSRKKGRKSEPEGGATTGLVSIGLEEKTGCNKMYNKDSETKEKW